MCSESMCPKSYQKLWWKTKRSPLGKKKYNVELFFFFSNGNLSPLMTKKKILE